MMKKQVKSEFEKHPIVISLIMSLAMGMALVVVWIALHSVPPLAIAGLLTGLGIWGMVHYVMHVLLVDEGDGDDGK